jgi:hypothetical protein
MARYTVRRDEDLLHILHRMGKSHLRSAVVSAPENKGLFVTRKAAMLREGDQVEIPEGQPLTFRGQTGRTCVFRVQTARRKIFLKFADASGAPASGSFRLEWEGGSCDGELSDGKLEAQVPVSVEEVSLTLPDRQMTLRVGRLDPVDCVSGVQARLRALSFLGGAESGALDGRTHRAIRAFQLRHDLPATGHADPATRRKLVEVSGT